LVLVLSAAAARGSLLHGPMLQGGTATNAYVLVESTVGISSPLTVNYGVSTAYDFSASTLFTKTSSLPSYVHVIKLTGLQPGTLYHYQVTGQATNLQDYTFRTIASA